MLKRFFIRLVRIAIICALTLGFGIFLAAHISQPWITMPLALALTFGIAQILFNLLGLEDKRRT